MTQTTVPMTTGSTTTVTPGGTPGPDLRELQECVRGQVLLPDSPEWEAVRRGWVVNVDQRPSAVVAAADAEDVAATVTWAAEHGVSVATQPVGHGATEAVSGTVLLRTGALQELRIDLDRRVARVGAGVKWGTLLAAVEPTGLTPLAGSNTDPSVVGYTVGGGLSWFSRAFGLAAHSVHAFDVVDATGTRRRVTHASDPDLFWAMCGGGGDFAVVVAIEVNLYDAGPVVGGHLMWPLEMARPVLRAFRKATTEAPDELSLWAHLLRFPPDPALPEPLRGRAFVSVNLAFLGSEAELDAHLAPLRELPALVSDTMAPVPMGQLGSIAAEPVDPMPVREMSMLLHSLDDGDLDRLLDVVGAGRDVPLVVVQLRHLGGALARANAEDGPNGAITEEYQVFCFGVPIDATVETGIEAGFSAVRASLAPQLSDRTLFNFLGAGSDPTASFSEESLGRLRRTKQVTDPAGVVRSNRPVG